MQLSADLIEGLVNGFLKKSFDKPAEIPDFHREMWERCCSRYKFVAIAAPRGFAKSTAITHSYTIANLVFRLRSFVLIVADTETQASFFLEDIKKELTTNEDLMQMFGIKGLEKDSTTDFILTFTDGHQCRVIAKGSGQSLRGLKWDNKRPDLIVGDDLENSEMVLNKERRDFFRRWVSGTLIPCLSKDGIIRVVGTILHTDSQLNYWMPRKGNRSQPIYEDDLREFSHPHQIWHSARYRAHDKLMKVSLWPEYKNIQWLMQERQEKIDQGLSDVWAQEMLNVPFDESTAPFRRAMFTEMVEAEKQQNFHYYITTDFASTDKQKSDYSVFLIAGVNSEGIVYILDVIHGRIDSLEILETLFALCSKYKPERVFVETGQQWGTLRPMIMKQMLTSDIWFNIEEMPSITDKRSRSMSIRARMKAKAVKFDKLADWYPDFEEECLRFTGGGTTHDDQVDALSMLGLALLKFVEAPTPEEELEEAYEEEYSQSGWNQQGRSESAGY